MTGAGHFTGEFVPLWGNSSNEDKIHCQHKRLQQKEKENALKECKS